MWSGAPGTMLFLSRRQAVSLAILGVNALVIALLALLFLAGWGQAAGLVALLLTIPFALDCWRFRNWLILRIGERYALTDRHLLVINGDGSLRSATGLLSVPPFRLTGASGTRSTIILGIDGPLWTPESGLRMKLKPSEDAPRFSGLDDGPAVLALIVKTAAEYEAGWVGSANEPPN